MVHMEEIYCKKCGGDELDWNHSTSFFECKSCGKTFYNQELSKNLLNRVNGEAISHGRGNETIRVKNKNGNTIIHIGTGDIIVPIDKGGTSKKSPIESILKALKEHPIRTIIALIAIIIILFLIRFIAFEFISNFLPFEQRQDVTININGQEVSVNEP